MYKVERHGMFLEIRKERGAGGTEVPIAQQTGLEQPPGHRRGDGITGKKSEQESEA